MTWTKQRYEIKLNDRKIDFICGASNGLLGISVGCTLTHLKSGYQIAEFRDEESAKRVGDYLSETYDAEFAALNKEYRWSMTHDEYKKLPSARDLKAKIKADVYFNSQLRDFAVHKSEANDGEE